jgi:ribonuclease VapC
VIVVDASAIVAIIAKEPMHERLALVLSAGDEFAISPVSHLEVVMALTRSMPNAKATADTFLDASKVRVISIDSDQVQWAAHAFLQYGKGRHPARLNLGDCFSYAAAKALNAPLLYTGGDFAKTDVRSA